MKMYKAQETAVGDGRFLDGNGMGYESYGPRIS